MVLLWQYMQLLQQRLLLLLLLLLLLWQILLLRLLALFSFKKFIVPFRVCSIEASKMQGPSAAAEVRGPRLLLLRGPPQTAAATSFAARSSR